MQDGPRPLEGVQVEDTEGMRAELVQLRTALARRPVIDMAKGAIMALTRCDEDAAFRQLSEVSQTNNVKLFDLATALLADLRRGEPSGLDAGGGAEREVDRLVRKTWTRLG
ncbi:ANTAR domain-containing protein [Kineococcus sp. SYSU DK002]|uniref:ANTAR domain-containing protein n=1 Tax=Kineococcus sp. SYSU DK002 TaxID=3383123 RepID=UPI003D7CE52B